MMFTRARLIALCPNVTDGAADAIASALESYATGYGVSTPLRAAHFMAQIAHESARLMRFEENLFYTADRIRAVWPRLAPRADELAGHPEKLANAAYAGRLGNGLEATGDGWRFRGRGLIQITGRDNYSMFGTTTGLPLLGNPDLAAEPANATPIALAFWRSRMCNDPANRDDVEGVTRRINGAALAGLADRIALTALAKTIFVAENTEALVA